MNLQTIADNFKQRDAIHERLQGIYAAIIDAEVAFAAKLNKKDLETYRRVFNELTESERQFGNKTLYLNGYTRFHFCTEEDAFEIIEGGIKGYGYYETQSGRLYDPIVIPETLFEAYDTDQWEEVLGAFMKERIGRIETEITRQKSATERARQKAAKDREQKERETYERLRTKYEGE